MTLNITEALSKLESCLRTGTLTSTSKIDLDTFVCLVQNTTQGKVYHQAMIDQFPEYYREKLFGKKMGDIIGEFKIVGVFDAWEEKDILGVLK